MYKHFGSKKELLASAVERHLVEIQSIGGVLDLMPLGDLRAELTLLPRWILADLERHRELFLIFEKEGDDLQELKDRYLEEVGALGYRLGAEYIERILRERDGPQQVEADELAAVAMNALVNHRRCEWTFGRKPLDLDDEQLVAGVVEVLMTIIAAETPA